MKAVSRYTKHGLVFFLVCFCALPVAGKPVVFWVSDPVQPDDTVLVAGHGFGAAPQVAIASLRKGISGKPWQEPSPPKPSGTVQVEVVQPSPESLKFVLPGKMRDGAYVAWVDSGDESSEPVYLNLPSVYWMQGDTGLAAASPGGWLRVFGRCISFPGKDSRIVLYREDTGEELRPKVMGSDLWSLKAILPADVRCGQWTVYLHNGLGRELGWRRVGNLQIEVPAPWPDRVLNVREFGATGTGTIADMLAIEEALKMAAEQGGGIVYLPRGRYLMDGTLTLPRFTVLRGEGRKLSSIVWPDMETPADLVTGEDHFGIEDLTLYATRYRHAIAADIRSPEAGNTFVRRVTLRAVIYRGHLKPEEVDRRFRESLKLSTGGGDSIRLGGDNIEISDCDIYGSGRAFYVYGARGGRICNNRFYNGRWGWYCLTGSDGLIFENNTLTGADLMSTGGGLNCLGSIYSQNVFYADNSIALCHGWDREAMTTDAGHGAYYGPIASARGEILVLPEAGKWHGAERWRGGGVFILGGTGMGQYRQVMSVADDQVTVTLDRPWDVPPDETSLVTITMMQQNYLFINNRFADAGIAIQYYGTSVNHVAAGNTSSRAGGFYNSGRWYRHYQPSWYCQFFENEILDGNCYRFGANNATDSGPSFLGTYGLQRGDNPAPLAYCSVHRRNHLHNNAEIRLVGVNPEHPGLRDVVVEHNIVEHADRGINVDKGCTGVWLRENLFRDVVSEDEDSAAARAAQEAEKARLLASSDPVYWQNFDNTRGRYFLDSAAFHFPGIATHGTVELVEGFSGQAGRFDGQAYLRVADRGLLRQPEITLSAWILTEKSKGRYGVMAKRDGGGAAAFVLAIRDRRLTFEGTDVDGAWSYNFLSDKAVIESGWNHVAVTCREEKEVILYCNGKEVGRKQVKRPLVTNDQPLTIGFEAWGGENNDAKASGNFIGLIDEVKIWSHCLSEEAITAEYAAGREAAAADVRRREDAARLAEEQKRRTEVQLTGTLGEGWNVVSVDDFSGSGLDRKWRTLRGNWTVKDGILHCGEVSFLALGEKLTPPVRIEYDARSPEPCDLTAFWGTMADNYRAGYFVGFASNGNTLNKLLKFGETVASADKPLAQPGKWHHVVTQVLADRVQMAVDGQMVFDWQDTAPPKGADTIGVIGWGAADFDNISIAVGPH